MRRKRAISFLFCTLVFSVPVFEQAGVAADVETVGDLKVSGVIDNYDGDGIKFPDGSTQTKACSACAYGILPITLGGTGSAVKNFVDLSTAQTVGGTKTFSSRIGSTVATGTAPLQVASTTMVTNLNAEMVGGQKLSGLDLRYGQRPVAQLPRANTITTLDSAGIVGYYTSITVGGDGLPVISYYDLTNHDLKVAHCSNASCTGATITTVIIAGDVGSYPSITVRADGLPIISYYDATNKDLKVARCSNASCFGAAINTPDSVGDVGWYNSIAMGVDGLPVISYLDSTNGDLKVAHCSNASCTSATITTLDSAGVVGAYTSITVGADGLPVISYYDSTNQDLKVAKCANQFCVKNFSRR
jgi:hypothetical protein